MRSYKQALSGPGRRERIRRGEKKTAFVNCSIFDGIRPEIRDNMTLLVEGETISALFPGGKFVIPEGCRQVDASGCTIMPGLIDSHVHICSPFTYDLTPQAVRQMAVQVALNNMITISSGVTTVCDMGGPQAIIREFTELTDKDLVPGPRYLNCFTLISPASGSRLGYPSQVKFLDPLTAWTLGGQVATRPRTLTELKRACRGVKESGGTHLKATYQPQPFSERKYPSQDDFPVFDDSWMRAILACARDMGLVVDIHAPYGGAAEHCADLAIEEGARIRIQHMTFDVDLTGSMVAKMRDYGFYMIPTMSVYADAFRLRDLINWLDSAPSQMMPEARRQSRAVIQKRIDEAPYSGKTVMECDYAYLRRNYDIVKRNTLKAHEFGIIGMGSDSGGTYTGFFGRIAEEARHYFETGIPFTDILKYLTSVNAEVHGLTDRGVIEPGKLADLVALKGNRPCDPSALDKVQMVMKGGCFLEHDGMESANNLIEAFARGTNSFESGK